MGTACSTGEISSFAAFPSDARWPSPGSTRGSAWRICTRARAPLWRQADVRRAAETAVAWAGESPLILGGDFNLRPGQTRLFEELATALRPRRPDRPRLHRPHPRPRARDRRPAERLAARGAGAALRGPSTAPQRPRPGRSAVRGPEHSPAGRPTGRRNEIVSFPQSNRGEREGGVRWRRERAVPGQAESSGSKSGAKRGAGRRQSGLSPALHPGSARRQERGGIPGCARAKRHPVARSASGGRGRRGPARSHDSQRRQRAGQQPDHPGPQLHRRPGEGARAPARPGAARARVANAPDAAAAPPRPPVEPRARRATPRTRRWPRRIACAGVRGFPPGDRSRPTTSSRRTRSSHASAT